MERESIKISKRSRMQIRYNSLLLQSNLTFYKEPVQEKLLSKLTSKVIKKKKDGKVKAIRQMRNNFYWKLRKKENMSKEVGISINQKIISNAKIVEWENGKWGLFLGKKYWELRKKPNRQHFIFSAANEDKTILTKKSVPQYVFIAKDF
jgi:hypothetical protein